MRKTNLVLDSPPPEGETGHYLRVIEGKTPRIVSFRGQLVSVVTYNVWLKTKNNPAADHHYMVDVKA